jgi:hypothetical protein
MMKIPVLSALLVVAWPCGVSVAYSQPDQQELSDVRRLSPEEIARWQKETRERFDAGALTEFLKRTISDHRTCDHVDLTKAKVGDRWVMDGNRMINGDWEFATSLKQSDSFELRYRAESDVFVYLQCRRVDTKRFKLVKVESTVLLKM